MPIAGSPLFLTAVAGVGAGDWAVKDAAPAANVVTKADFATSATVRYLQARPGTTTSGTGSSTPSSTATGVGWNILAADMDVSGAKRVIPAGTWLAQVTMAAATADITATFGIRFHCYRKAAAVYTMIGSPIEIVNLSAAGAGAAQAIDLNLVVATDMFFAVGETLHCEFWIKGRGGGATGLLAQSLTFNLGASGVGDLTLPLQGLRTVFLQSGAGVGVGVTTRNLRLRLTRAGVGVGVVVMGRWVRATKTAIGVGVAARSVWVRPLPKTAVAIGLGNRGGLWIRKAPTGAVGIGIPTVVKMLPKTFARVAVGVGGFARALVAARVVAAVAVGVSGFTRAVVAVRQFAAATVGLVAGRLELDFDAFNRVITGGPSDWPLNTPTKTISGVVRDSTGTPYVAATVQLVRESDGFLAATTTSAGNGAYSFTRGGDDPWSYRVLAWEDTGTPTQGVSARGLVPV